MRIKVNNNNNNKVKVKVEAIKDYIKSTADDRGDTSEFAERKTDSESK